MYKPEIVAGLKNTMERGYSLERAIESFINAGYSREDVIDSAEQLKQEPTRTMQVTAPVVTEKNSKKPSEDKKPGFFQKIHLPHIHFASRSKEKERIEQVKIEEAKRIQEEKIAAEEPVPKEIDRMHAAEKSRIKKIEMELKTKKKEPEKPEKLESIPEKKLDATAILELEKIAPKKIKMDKREIAIGKRQLKPVQKHEVKLRKERTEILGLQRKKQRKSDNAIFIILIILLVMLLGALLYTYFYREALIDLIKRVLGE